jgi:hypothetical protein
MNAKMTNDSPKHHHRPLPQCFQLFKKASSMATLMAKASLVSAWYSRSLAFSAAGMGNGWRERSDANKEVPPCVGASSRAEMPGTVHVGRCASGIIAGMVHVQGAFVLLLSLLRREKSCVEEKSCALFHDRYLLSCSFVFRDTLTLTLVFVVVRLRR